MGAYPHGAVNAVALLHIELQPSRGVDTRDDILTHAAEIRNSLEKLKDPQLIEDMVTDFANIQSQAAWSRDGRHPAKENCLTMNITRRWVPGCFNMNMVETIPYLQIGLEKPTFWTPRNGYVSQ